MVLFVVQLSDCSAVVHVLAGPKRSGGIQAKIFFERLKDVPLVPQQHVLTIRNLGEGSYGRVSLGFCPGLGEIAVKWNKVGGNVHSSVAAISLCVGTVLYVLATRFKH